MEDKAHRLTDEKLEEMESGCLPFIPGRKRKYKRRLMNTFPNLPNRTKPSGNFWNKVKSPRKNMQNGARALVLLGDNRALIPNELLEQSLPITVLVYTDKRVLARRELNKRKPLSYERGLFILFQYLQVYQVELMLLRYPNIYNPM